MLKQELKNNINKANIIFHCHKTILTNDQTALFYEKNIKKPKTELEKLKWVWKIKTKKKLLTKATNRKRETWGACRPDRSPSSSGCCPWTRTVWPSVPTCPALSCYNIWYSLLQFDIKQEEKQLCYKSVKVFSL